MQTSSQCHVISMFNVASMFLYFVSVLVLMSQAALPDALIGLIGELFGKAFQPDMIFSNQFLLLNTIFTLILALVRIAIHSCSACRFIPFSVCLNMLQKSKRCSIPNTIFYDDIYRLTALAIFSSDPGALIIFFDN